MIEKGSSMYEHINMEKSSYSPTTEEVYASALFEHPTIYPELEENGADLKDIIGSSLEIIESFEKQALKPLEISKETAEDIGTIFVFSGTGNMEKPFKIDDNPRLTAESWRGWADRARLIKSFQLFRKITEARSGVQFDSLPIPDPKEKKEAIAALVQEYGPHIVYNGYDSENENLTEYLERPGRLVPPEKVKILGKDLKVTTDQITTFEYPDMEGIEEKQVALVSHAPHLAARILRIANKYKPFGESAVPYVVPLGTPEAGRKESALTETRGALYYIFIREEADIKPHPYQFLK